MTTAFVQVVRCEPVGALENNAAGTLVALVAIGLVPWSLASAVTGRLIAVRSMAWSTIVLTGTVVAVSLLGWTLRLLLS
jgi:hypothetical protein